MYMPSGFAENCAESIQNELPLNSYCCFEWVVNLWKPQKSFTKPKHWKVKQLQKFFCTPFRVTKKMAETRTSQGHKVSDGCYIYDR